MQAVPRSFLLVCISNKWKNLYSAYKVFARELVNRCPGARLAAEAAVAVCSVATVRRRPSVSSVSAVGWGKQGPLDDDGVAQVGLL